MWKHGQRTALAKEAGIKKSYLSDILNRRKAPRVELAERLELASIKVLGVKILWTVWVKAKTTGNLYFSKREE